MILNALNLKIDEEISSFQIDYIHESYYGEQISIYYYKENNAYYLEAKSGDRIIFLAMLSLK